MIYLDNAATTLRKPPQVIDAVVAAMNSFGNSARGTHEEALAASRVIYDTRCKLATLFHCKRPDHVAFTCNSTEALNIAIHGCIHAGEHVISTDLEHNSVLRPLYRLERENNVKLSFVPADRQGNIDYADFERLLRPDTRAVVCTHASNLTGNVLDLARIGQFAHAHRLLFIVDASQSAGVLPIDMEQMHIDVLCFTGHKGLMGPQGTGGLYVRPGLQVAPLVVGGSGSGKTRFFCKPGIMSVNCSYLIVDPKGEMLRSTGYLLKDEGYDIKVFDLIHPRQSDGYNPFTYIRDDPDVLKLMDNLVKNTTPPKGASNDPFWEKAEIALDSALMLYLLYEAPVEEQNFEMLIYMMNFAEVREEDEQYRSPLDMLFRALEEEQPAHVAVKQYKVFKQAAGKTAKSILVTAAVRLAAFNIPQYAAMTSMDEMDFGSLGERKRAIFCVIPVNDSSMNYLVGMLYTQCFQELYRRADLKYNGRLPVPVRVLQDEWANVAQPESYPKILATCRSYNIGLNIIVQNVQQIKALYEKEHESIIGNCDTLLFLGGGNEPASLEFIVKLLGRETLATRTRGLTKGRNGSSNTNYQQTGRDLMTIDEVRKLDTNKAILFIRGEDPVIDRKYNLKRHPNIKLTLDGKAKPYIHKPQGVPDYALPDLPYAFKSLDDYDFIDVEEPEHELSEKEKDFKPDKTE